MLTEPGVAHVSGFAASRWFLLAVLGLTCSLTTATQLRPATMWFGPMEVFLSILVAYLLAANIVRRSIHLARAVRYAMIMALGIGMAYFVGFMIAESRGIVADSRARDFLALLFAMSVAVVTLDLARRCLPYRHALACVVVVLTLPTFALFAASMVSPNLFGLQLDYYGVRFQGWSDNPNQIAMVLVPLPFLSMFAAAQTRNRSMRLLMYGTCAGAIVSGLGTLSDALLASWCVAISAWVVLAALERGRQRGARASAPPRLGNWLLVHLVILLATLSVLSATTSLVSDILQRESNQGSVRLLLWVHGMQAAGESPWFGLGPGAHSGVTGPHAGLEAHNTWIDLLAGAGFIGLAAYVAFLVWVAGGLLKPLAPLLVATLVALLVFSTFHFVLRHPTFWFYLALVAAFASRAGGGRMPSEHDGPQAASGERDAIQRPRAAGGTG